MKTEDKYISLLQKEKHFVSCFYLDPVNLSDVNFANFKSDQKEEVQESINSIKQHLSAPIIQDDFDEHAERRKWRDKMKSTYPWFCDFYDGNLLRINNISTILYAVYMITGLYAGKHGRQIKQKKKRIQKYIQMQCGKYHRLAVEDKIQFLKTVRNSIVDYFEILSH